MTSWGKYGAGAERWSDEAYADPAAYLAHRAELVVSLGPPLATGDTALDLACGDGGPAAFLPRQRHLGVDASAEMVDAARRRGRDVVHADLNEFAPAESVAATTIFRAIYYARGRREFLCRVAGYTERKLVFDLNPRQFALSDVRADLEAAGFDGLTLRPFFVPQTSRLPRPALRALVALERSGPLARLALRFRFTYLCAAFRRTNV